MAQKELAVFLGLTPDTVSRQLRGELPLQPYVVNFIRAWERLSAKDRAELWELRKTTLDETAPSFQLQAQSQG